MKPEIANVERTLEYGQSHDLARALLPYTLVGILLGLVLLTPLDAAEVDRKASWLGWTMVLLSLAILATIVYRRTLPSVPSIVLSPQGLLFRDMSETVIPWNEIRDVGIREISAARDLTSTKVTSISVSPQLLSQLTGGKWLDSVVARDGDPSEIYLSYYRHVPFDEFQAAVRNRWHAFSRRAEGQTPPTPFAKAVTAPSPESVYRNTGETLAKQPGRTPSVRRAQSLAGQVSASLQAMTGLIRGTSPGQAVVIAAAVAGITALLANQAGLWSTERQDTARARAAEWRKHQEAFDRDRAATDAEQRRSAEQWDKTWACMDEYWDLIDRGVYQQDPECMKKAE